MSEGQERGDVTGTGPLEQHAILSASPPSVEDPGCVAKTPSIVVTTADNIGSYGSSRRVSLPRSASSLFLTKNLSKKIADNSWGRGIRRDLQNCFNADYFISFGINYTMGDWRKVLATSLYIYFAQILPAISFGYLLYTGTGGNMGVVEVMLSFAVGGVMFSFLSGAPLVVMGVTGPVTLYTIGLYSISSQFQINFFAFYFWTCFWTSLLCMAIAIMGLCEIYTDIVTLFSADSFSFIIAMVYTSSAIENLLSIHESSPSNLQFSILLAFGTFMISLVMTYVDTDYSVCLSQVRRLCRWCQGAVIKTKGMTLSPEGSSQKVYCSPCGFLGPNSISFIKDYAFILSIIIMSSCQSLKGGIDHKNLPCITLPSTFQPTTSRPWVMVTEIGALPVAYIFAAFISAIFLTLLLYFDHHVSCVLAQRRARFEKTSYNWDFFLLGLNILLCGLLGIPLNYGHLPQAPLHVEHLLRTLPEEAKVVVKTREPLYLDSSTEPALVPAESPRALNSLSRDSGFSDKFSWSPTKGARSRKTEDQRVQALSTRWTAFAHSVLIAGSLSDNLLFAIGRIPIGVLAGMFLFIAWDTLVDNSLRKNTFRDLLCFNRSDKNIGRATVQRYVVISQLIIVGAIFYVTFTPALLIFPVFIIGLVVLSFLIRRYALANSTDELKEQRDIFEKERLAGGSREPDAIRRLRLLKPVIGTDLESYEQLLRVGMRWLYSADKISAYDRLVVSAKIDEPIISVEGGVGMEDGDIPGECDEGEWAQRDTDDAAERPIFVDGMIDERQDHSFSSIPGATSVDDLKERDGAGGEDVHRRFDSSP